MKTPEEMAEEYGNTIHKDQDGFDLDGLHWSHIAEWEKRAFLAGYAATQPKWISVKEWLPEYYQEVLFYGPKYKYFFVGYRAERGAYVDPEENGLTDDLIFKYYNFWMPLPEPPKENE